jgi:hypothetical protein
MVNLTTSSPNPAKPSRASGDETWSIPRAQVSDSSRVSLTGPGAGSRHDSAQSGQEFNSSPALFFYTLCDSAVLVPTGPV